MERSRLAPAAARGRDRSRPELRRRQVACAKAVTSHRTPNGAGTGLFATIMPIGQPGGRLQPSRELTPRRPVRFWKGCKPNSVCPACARERIICLSGQYPKPGWLAPTLERAAPKVSYWTLHPMGFSVPPRLRLERWALTPPFHPYPGRCQPWRYILCGTVRRDASRRALPRVSADLTARGYAASRPVVFGLSSPGLRQERFPTLPKSKTCRTLGQRAVIARGVVSACDARSAADSELSR